MPDELLFDDDCDNGDDGDGPAVTIIEERPPLRAGKVFVDYGERAAISENLEAAHAALNQAFRGIWIEKALEYGHVREYWDEEDIDELEMLTLDASSAVKRAWRSQRCDRCARRPARGRRRGRLIPAPARPPGPGRDPGHGPAIGHRRHRPALPGHPAEVTRRAARVPVRG